MMKHPRRFARGLSLGFAVSLAAAAVPAQAPAPAPQKKAAPAKAPTAAPAPAPPLEPRAIEILKASCDRLAVAKSMSFTALGAYEVPGLYGPALVYGRTYEVTLQRPAQLAVITPGDGPRTEFYDDGKVMMSFHPAENLVAVTEAPPTIDAALKKIYEISGTYFPFTDLVVSNPWKDIESGLTAAFYVGESSLLDGTTTDVVAYESYGVFIQTWIGRNDKLPRMARATYHDDPLQLRQAVTYRDWRLDASVPGEAFTSAKAAGADRIAFGHPRMKSDFPSAARPTGPGKTSSPKPKATPKPK
jgi:hypothetical protein